MCKVDPPKLKKKIMDKKLSLKSDGGSHVHGILRESDPFTNLVRENMWIDNDNWWATERYRNGGKKEEPLSC